MSDTLNIILSITVYGGGAFLLWFFVRRNKRWHQDQRARIELKEAWELGHNRGYKTKDYAGNHVPIAFEEECPSYVDSVEGDYSRTRYFYNGFDAGKQKRLEEELKTELAKERYES